MLIVRLGAAIAPLAAVLALAAVPAEGSFPGRNGDISVVSTTVNDRQWLVFLSPAGTERRRVRIAAGAGGFSASPDARIWHTPR